MTDGDPRPDAAPADAVGDRDDPWSLTEIDLFDRLRDRLSAGEPTVVATVVAVDGSAYRRPGAKMAVGDDGAPLGAVTPGCLEGPLVDCAIDVLAADTPRLQVFDLTDDESWGFGLGCNGVVTVLLEPAGDRWSATLDALDAGESTITAIVVDDPKDVGEVDAETNDEIDASSDETTSAALRARIAGEYEDGPVRVDAVDDGFPRAAVADALNADSAAGGVDLAGLARDGGTATLEVEGSTILLDAVTPPDELLVFGSQGDVRPVTRLARQVGFRVRVATPRGAVDADAFPAAHDVESVRAPDLARLVTDPQRTYPVLMSHNFVDDRLALESLLSTDVPYVGLMGPRKRFDEMRRELAEEGVSLARSDRERIATPVGLDLGGCAPVEIACSVVSEVLAVANGRDGGRLTDSEGPVHPRERTGPEKP